MNYFNDIKFENYFKNLNTDYKYYAHRKIKDNKEIKEELYEHINLSDEYFLKLFKLKNLDKVFENIENITLKGISHEGISFFRKLILNTIHFHDIGKILIEFQKIKMKNKNIDDLDVFKTLGSNHSMASSVFYIDYFIKELKKLPRKDRSILRVFLYLNAYTISRHHSSLDDFNKFLEKFDDGMDAFYIVEAFSQNKSLAYLKDFSLEIKDNGVSDAIIIKRIFNKPIEESIITKELGIALYAYQRLLMSLIFASDFYATSEFMSEIKTKNFGELDNINDFYGVYKNTDLYKTIRNYEKTSYGKTNDFSNEKNINILRTEMFLDTEAELLKRKSENLFYVEAPTGCGKSNVSMNLSFQMIKHDPTIQKIYYIYPFNTLVEQNKEILNKIFENNLDTLNKIAVINSITPIKTNTDNNEDEYLEDTSFENYSKALLDRQFLNYPFILSTSVGIFNTMFSTKKEDIFPFHQLVNSVIVLDEIQSYKISIWTEIITFLKNFAQILNIKVIIMSATLPNLNLLLDEEIEPTNLVQNREKYFSNPLFKDRCKIDYSLINTDLDNLLNHVEKSSKDNKKILIEFIKKKTAYEFFDRINDLNLECEVFLLTGDDNSIDRAKIINKLKSDEINQNGVVLISTQIIEAGVDIDMDIGYKDSSKVDSEEQLMGRINRSCKKDGIVYFFNIDEAEKIYKNDVRTYKSLTINPNIDNSINTEIRNVLENKDFSFYYKNVLDEIKKHNNSTNENLSIDIFFADKVCKLDFIEIEKRMKIIDDDRLSKTIFLSREIYDLEDNLIDGEAVWNEYKTLLMDNNMDYAKKKIKLSEVSSKLNYFIYKVPKNYDIPYEDYIGDFLYIGNGENYFKDGKLNTALLKGDEVDFI